MRTLQFVDHLSLEYKGNISDKAVVTGDVDNDGNNEMVVCNAHGDMLIFKASQVKPWRQLSGLGMVTCVAVTDFLNQGTNEVVTLSAEGWCHVITVLPDPPVTKESDPTETTGSLASVAREGESSELTSGGRPRNESGDTTLVRVVHRQQLFANNKALLVADIDGDGQNEMVVAYTDRRVRSFRWQLGPELPDLSSGGSFSSRDFRPTSVGGATPTVAPPSGKIVLLESWSLAGQVGSVSMLRRKDGGVDVMASQPGGAYVTLVMQSRGSGGHVELKSNIANSTQSTATGTSDSQATAGKGEESGGSQKDSVEASQAVAHSQTNTSTGVTDSEESTNLTTANVSRILYQPLGSGRCRNTSISTELVAGIRAKDTSQPDFSAICTLDGTLTLVDPEGRILWSLQVDHQLFSIARLDITADGCEEVVACSWDGHTYFVNLNKDMVRFHFPHNVAAFHAGYYAAEAGRNVPCLIYATFDNQIKLYYNIRVSQIGLTSLLETMAAIPEAQSLLQHFSCSTENPDKVRQLFHWCLYGYQPAPT